MRRFAALLTLPFALVAVSIAGAFWLCFAFCIWLITPEDANRIRADEVWAPFGIIADWYWYALTGRHLW